VGVKNAIRIVSMYIVQGIMILIDIQHIQMVNEKDQSGATREGMGWNWQTLNIYPQCVERPMKMSKVMVQ
jgi:hypothetical protein